VDADIIEEEELFRAIDRSAAHVLVIGRRAMVAIGIPRRLLEAKRLAGDP
jgi:hypothetical protein